MPGNAPCYAAITQPSKTSSQLICQKTPHTTTQNDAYIQIETRFDGEDLHSVTRPEVEAQGKITHCG